MVREAQRLLLGRCSPHHPLPNAYVNTYGHSASHTCRGFSALGRQVSNADSNSYQHSNTNAHRDTNINADEYPHANLYPYRNANAIANSYTHGHTDPHPYADRNTYRDPDGHAYHGST
jgi:hypothetical protein